LDVFFIAYIFVSIGIGIVTKKLPTIRSRIFLLPYEEGTISLPN
jgi:hypothetical protein